MHDLLQSVRQAHQGSARQQIVAGLFLPFKSAKFLLDQSQLIPLVVLPALVNLVLFAVSGYLMVTHAGELVTWIWDKPVGEGVLATVLVVLWYAVYVLAIVAAIILSYVVVLVIGGIVASPFNDVLSERTECVLRGVDSPAETDASLVGELLRSVVSSAGIGLSYLMVMTPVLLLNLIPVVGSALSTVLGICASAYFVGLEYTDPTFERQGVRLGQKFGRIWDNIELTGSFGLSTTMLLWVPLMNFVCMPIAVIGGTVIGVVLDED